MEDRRCHHEGLLPPLGERLSLHLASGCRGALRASTIDRAMPGFEANEAYFNREAVWSSAVPQLNAEIWTVSRRGKTRKLELLRFCHCLRQIPPACRRSASVRAFVSRKASSVHGELPNVDVFINLTIAHEVLKQFIHFIVLLFSFYLYNII